MPRRFRVLADIGPLRRSAAYRRLWVGTTVSSIGGSLANFAVILQIYRLTHSSFAVGALGLVQVVPLLAVGLLAGSLTDAFDRRRLTLVTGSLMSLVPAVLAVQAFAGLRVVWLLYGLVAVQSAVGAIDWPARAAPVPSLVPERERTAALALTRFSFQLVLVVGPALAGVIAAVFGLPVALFPAINEARFGGSPRTLGSAALSGPLRHLARPGRAMLITVAVWGAAFAGFALARTLWLTLALLAAAGAADVFTVVFRGAILQNVTPEPLRGRVMAADYVVGAGGAQLGNLEAGSLASLTTPVISAVTGGLATVSGAMILAVVAPGFYRYRWTAGAPDRTRPRKRWRPPNTRGPEARHGASMVAVGTRR